MPNSQNEFISQKNQELIDKLVLGKLSLAEIAKIVGVSEQWLQSYVNSQCDLASR